MDLFKKSYLVYPQLYHVCLKSYAVHRINEGYRAWGALKIMLSNRGLRIKAKKCLYDGVIVPTALYGTEAWGVSSAERRKVNLLEMKWFILIGVSNG